MRRAGLTAVIGALIAGGLLAQRPPAKPAEWPYYGGDAAWTRRVLFWTAFRGRESDRSRISACYRPR